MKYTLAIVLFIVGVGTGNVLTSWYYSSKSKFKYVDYPEEITQVTSSKDSIDLMGAWQHGDTLCFEFMDDGRVSRH